MTKQAHLPTLIELFRQYGYEGLTISKLSQETGLGKASLYHHFPGGKAEMAESALVSVNQWLETNILQQLAEASVADDGTRSPNEVFEAMCQKVDRFFSQGEIPCLWSVSIAEQSSYELLHGQISWAFSRWIEGIASVLVSAGLSESLARRRGEDALISIQGALIVSQGLNDLSPFQRVIAQLPQQLCRDL